MHSLFYVSPNFCTWVLCWSLVWYTLLLVLSSFAIILKRKRELVALLLLFFGCLVTVNVLWLFLMVPWAGLQCVIVVYPDHTYFLLKCWVRDKITQNSLFILVYQTNVARRQKVLNYSFVLIYKIFHNYHMTLRLGVK